MPTLFVKCRACGHDFPTRVGEPETGPSGVIVSGLRLRCPKCGKEDQYSTADFHFPGGTASPPSGARATDESGGAAGHEAKQHAEQEKLAGYGVVPPEDRTTHES